MATTVSYSYTEHISFPLEEEWVMATGNMYRIFGEIWTCGFWHMRVEKQTEDIQT